jgi:hypothetical protein
MRLSPGPRRRSLTRQGGAIVEAAFLFVLRPGIWDVACKDEVAQSRYRSVWALDTDFS